MTEKRFSRGDLVKLKKSRMKDEIFVFEKYDGNLAVIRMVGSVGEWRANVYNIELYNNGSAVDDDD